MTEIDQIQNTSTKVPFKVAARTAKLIGLENFSNEEGAIIELVKNTYDADSKNCILIFDIRRKTIKNAKGEDVIVVDRENSKIFIVDNGIGMTDVVIKNQWMTIGTNDKLYDHTTTNKRVKTGAKGIGRFALNRLGLFTNLLTLPENQTKGYEWLVDWRDFDKEDATVSDVEALLSENEGLDLKTELKARFEKFSKIEDLITSISFDSGTLIEISELNDSWEDDQLTRLFANLEMLIPPKEQSDFRIDLFSLGDIEGFGKVKTAYYDDFDYKIETQYNENNDGQIEVTVTRNELDVDVLERRYLDVFGYEAMKAEPFRLEDFKQKKFVIKKALSAILSEDIDKNLLEKIGKFDFTFYFLKNTISDDKADGNLKKYPYKNINSSNRKSWLKKFGGIKIFRDDFRIRPYGENGEDWLKLGERQAQSPGGPGQRLGGYRIGPNQISGAINISRIHNLSFQDKSGREGIIENDVFELFKNVIKEIIALFEKDRNIVMYHLSELFKKNNEEEIARQKAQAEAENIRKAQEAEAEKPADEPAAETSNDYEHPGDNSQQSNQQNSYSEREKILAEGIQILTQDVDKRDDEIRLLRSLASVGLIISSFAHEVKSLRSRLLPRTKFLLQELSVHLDESSLSNINKEDNPFYMIRLMQEEDTKLKHWLDYSLNTLRRDKRERTNLDFSEYFERFRSTWAKALQQRNVVLELNGVEKGSCIIRAFEVDMDSIFNNLLSNSINALSGFNKDEKKIVIEWKKAEQNIEILFSDNGKGLDEQYIEAPETIFNLNESSKKDNRGNVIGTGLGLYIVKSIIEEYNNSNISVLSFDKGLQFKITFITRNKNEI
jgi:signal transduction histidine kinase